MAQTNENPTQTTGFKAIRCASIQLRWVFTCVTNGAKPEQMVKVDQIYILSPDKKLFLLASLLASFIRSKVGLIASIFSKVCSIL